MKLRNVDIKGRSFPIEIENDGTFLSTFDSERISAKSLDELKTKLRQFMSRSKVKISIPFVRWDHGELKHGTMTGLHARNNSVLVKWKDGASEQQNSWSSGDYIPVDLARDYIVLSQNVERAARQLEAFRDKHNIDAKKAIIEALPANVRAEYE